ncbi:MAG: hypothetical protein MUD08_12675 [Cytophagales bacterium]|jgi:hypothetical protein|nr:hypothetical protein [Cytophagales bacterium]
MRLLPFCLVLLPLLAQAQSSYLSEPVARWSPADSVTQALPIYGPQSLFGANALRAKLRQRNYGAQLGFQRGAYNFLEMGFEHHWRTISLTNPRMFSVGGSFGYNFWDNTAEYKVGAWYKWGRVALTYGGNLVYATNFEQGKIGVAPVVGFRLLGFHLTTGYNFLWGGDEAFREYNRFYVSLRYYFPIDNTFKWKKRNKGGKNDRKDKKDRDKKDFKWPWQKK